MDSVNQIANHKSNLLILSFTLLVIMLGFGVVLPIMPFYIEELGAGGTELGLLVAVYAIACLIFGPFWGHLSDKVGRKPILMIGILGYGITMILFGLATKLWMLFIFRALSGVLSSATSPTTMAYVSDSTTEKDRGSGMGTLGAAMGIGTVLGPGLGGVLANESLTTPFFIAGGLAILALILVWILLPESLSHESREIAKVNPRIGYSIQIWKDILSGPIGILLLMAFLTSYATITFFSIFGLYASAKFNYGPQEVGIMMMVIGLISALAQVAMTGPLTRLWGESFVIKGTLALTAIGFIGLSLANTYVSFLVAIGIFTLATSLLTPAVTSLTSKRATMQQGITMGISNSFMSLARIIGPAFAGLVFDFNIEFPNWSSAIIMMAGFILSLIWLKNDLPVVDRYSIVQTR